MPDPPIDAKKTADVKEPSEDVKKPRLVISTVQDVTRKANGGHSKPRSEFRLNIRFATAKEFVNFQHALAAVDKGVALGFTMLPSHEGDDRWMLRCSLSFDAAQITTIRAHLREAARRTHFELIDSTASAPKDEARQEDAASASPSVG